jgi:hypothetical protein
MCLSDPTPCPLSLTGKGENLGGFPFSASERDKTLASPKPTMVGKLRVQGGEAAMAGGLGGALLHAD